MLLDLFTFNKLLLVVVITNPHEIIHTRLCEYLSCCNCDCHRQYQKLDETVAAT